MHHRTARGDRDRCHPEHRDSAGRRAVPIDADVPRERDHGQPRAGGRAWLPGRAAPTVLRIELPGRRSPLQRDVLQLRGPVARVCPRDTRKPRRQRQRVATRLRDRGVAARPHRVRTRLRLNADGFERISEGVISTYRPPGTPAHSVGIPRPRPGSDVVVVNPDTREECPAVEVDAQGRLTNASEAIGEIVDRGGAPGFEGYYRNDEAMSSRLRDGWYWTGDLAYRDADGYLYFAGRSND